MNKNVFIAWVIVISTFLSMVAAEWLFIGLAISGTIGFTTGLVAALLVWIPILGIGGTIAYKWERGHDIGNIEISDSIEEESNGDEQRSIEVEPDSDIRTDPDDGDSEHQS